MEMSDAVDAFSEARHGKIRGSFQAFRQPLAIGDPDSRTRPSDEDAPAAHHFWDTGSLGRGLFFRRPLLDTA